MANVCLYLKNNGENNKIGRSEPKEKKMKLWKKLALGAVAVVFLGLGISYLIFGVLWKKPVTATTKPAIATVETKSSGCTVKAAKAMSHNAAVLADYQKKDAATKLEEAKHAATATKIMGPRDQDRKGGGICYPDIKNPSVIAESGWDVRYDQYTLAAVFDKTGVCKLKVVGKRVCYEVSIESDCDMPNIIMLATDPEWLKQGKDGSWTDAIGYFLSQFRNNSFGSVMKASGLRNFFLRAFSNETVMRASGWLLDNDTMWKNLRVKRQALVKAWLPQFYRASKANMPNLLRKVRVWDNLEAGKGARGKDEEYYNYWDKYPKSLVATHFLRTWLRDGGEHNSRRADELLAVRQFWMVMLAYKVGHSQADKWASEVASKFEGASSLWYKSWYISTLFQKKMPPPPKGNSLYVEPSSGSGSLPTPEVEPESKDKPEPPAKTETKDDDEDDDDSDDEDE
ncbi:MAG: hypothetical protein HQ530_02070 [Parcubacteria group bacterium]|nr:hypothetical protein [Parcubacteria group bacterium]